MKIKKTLVAALLGLSLVGTAASPAMARERDSQARGADDRPGHVRHGGGADDGVNHR